jgi:hypothetical protein
MDERLLGINVQRMKNDIGEIEKRLDIAYGELSRAQQALDSAYVAIRGAFHDLKEFESDIG